MRSFLLAGIVFSSLSSELAFADTVSIAPYYEINSESVSLRRNIGWQQDLKAMAGTRWQTSPDFSLRVLGGAGWYRQETKNFANSEKVGSLLQVKASFLQDRLSFIYENFSFLNRSDWSLGTENRFGLAGGILYLFKEDRFQGLLLDVYGESFYIPEVSSQELLSVVRLSLLQDTGWTQERHQIDGVFEIYHKAAPENWGSEYSELRLGFRYQPFSWMSGKLMLPLWTNHASETSSWVGQLNIFYPGTW